MPQHVSPVEVEKALKGVNYPVKKQDLIRKAEQNKAPQEVCEVLNQIPEQEYTTPVDVSKAIGKIDRS